MANPQKLLKSAHALVGILVRFSGLLGDQNGRSAELLLVLSEAERTAMPTPKQAKEENKVWTLVRTQVREARALLQLCQEQINSRHEMLKLIEAEIPDDPQDAPTLTPCGSVKHVQRVSLPDVPAGK